MAIHTRFLCFALHFSPRNLSQLKTGHFLDPGAEIGRSPVTWSPPTVPTSSTFAFIDNGNGCFINVPGQSVNLLTVGDVTSTVNLLSLQTGGVLNASEVVVGQGLSSLEL